MRKSKKEIRERNKEAVRNYRTSHKPVSLPSDDLRLIDAMIERHFVKTGERINRPEVLHSLIEKEALLLGLINPGSVTGKGQEAPITSNEEKASLPLETPQIDIANASPGEEPAIEPTFSGQGWKMWVNETGVWIEFGNPDIRRYFLKNHLGFYWDPGRNRWYLLEKIRPKNLAGEPLSNQEVADLARQHLAAEDSVSREAVQTQILSRLCKPAHVAVGT